MFSKTVMRAKIEVTWKLRERPRRLISLGAGGRRCACPLSAMAPAETGKRPLIRLKSVVLPAPLGPMIACRDPRAHLEAHPHEDRGGAEALAHVGQLKARRHSHRGSCAPSEALDLPSPTAAHTRSEAAHLVPQPEPAHAPGGGRRLDPGPRGASRVDGDPGTR